MSLEMPEPDRSVLQRRNAIAERLAQIIGPDNLVSDPEELRAYECDGLTAYRQPPMLVALPDSAAQIAEMLSYCKEEAVPVVARGSGTSLSGGALPLEDCLLIVLSKLNRILSVDYEHRYAVVQPGVTNLSVSQAVEHRQLYYAPDPSSQIICTIGGNVAENSGGVHCLKYGLTSHNVLGVEMILMDGTRLRLGGPAPESPGLDLLSVCIGSEGLLGIVTEVTLRLLPKPESARALLIGFASVEEAGQTVSDIIAAGIIPAGLELMDRPAVQAAEAFVKAGYPLDVEALLIVELDGSTSECSALLDEVESIAMQNAATSVRASESEEERLRFWAGRKAAFPAVGRLAPDYYCMDGTIPRKRLPEVLKRISVLSSQYGLGVANVFHAGDGNLHPLILYDANVPGELEKAEEFGAEILLMCVDVGGVLTGEHGVGVEKRELMPAMFNEVDLKYHKYVKQAFDPTGQLNPGKVFPLLNRCAEGRMHVHRGKLPFDHIPRF